MLLMGSKLKVYSDTIVYVICPAGIKSGGPELLHQFASLLQNKIETYIYYVDITKPSYIIPEYEKYNCKSIRAFDNKNDNKHNILVIPETRTEYCFKFKKIQKAIWWLSVDNYSHQCELYNIVKKLDFYINSFLLQDRIILPFSDRRIVHLVQSRYAELYLRKNGIKKCWPLSDYINDEYKTDIIINKREKIVLYNPRKGWDFTQKIIKQSNHILYLPIKNMTNKQIIELMDRSKVYIDFGNHPGKDRLPREAALRGLCIITGKRGAAGNDKDIQIPNKYKFQDVENSITDIIKCINNCLDNYESCVNDFEDYRKLIWNEKTIFEQEVNRIFG